MLTIASAFDPSRSRVADHLTRIERELVSTDRRLERAEYDRLEPGRNWAGWFDDASREMYRAGQDFSRVTDGGMFSGARGIARDLERAARDLAKRGDEVARMDRYNQPFGRGWGRVLDGAISTVEDALRELSRNGRY